MRGSPRHVGGGRRFLGDLALSVCRKTINFWITLYIMEGGEAGGVEDEG